MKIYLALVVCLAAHASMADASCEDDATSLEDFMRHTEHVADPLNVPDGIHLVARDDLAPSWRALTIDITPVGFADEFFKYSSLAKLEKAFVGYATMHADPEWRKSKPGLAGHYDDILLVVDASATWSDAVSVANLAAKSGFTRVSFVFARAKQPVPPAHSSVDDLVAKATTSNELMHALITAREGLEQQCPGLAVALTSAKLQHDTYENTVIPAVRSWLTACRCNVPAPELRSYLFYMFAPRSETGLVTIELDKHAPAIALPARTPWRNAAPKLVAGKVWLVAK